MIHTRDFERQLRDRAAHYRRWLAFHPAAPDYERQANLDLARAFERAASRASQESLAFVNDNEAKA